MVLIGAYFHIHRGRGYDCLLYAFSTVLRLKCVLIGSFGPYLIPSFVLWALDRFLRTLRTIWNNQLYCPTSTSIDATAELISPTMVRLILNRKMTWRAGQNAYITIPGISRIPFEAHPFTIASIPSTCPMSSTDAGSKEDVGGGKTKTENELVFLIRARQGFTKCLRDAADHECRVPLSVYVDGPYGSPPDVNAFETVILIAGLHS